MLSIAVCDDELIECCDQSMRVKKILEDMKMPCSIRQFGSGKELLRTKEHFDIIFLDIMMRDLDGIQTAHMLREKAADSILIFLSSSREYVFEAYDVEAFHYLVKPIGDKKLKTVLRRAVLKTKKHPHDFMIVKKERQTAKLLLDDIYYFEITGRTVVIHGASGNFTYYERIGVLEENLQGKGFFRCHKSYLVNLRHVDGFNRQEIILDSGEKIAVAKRRYEAFCGEMLQYIRRSGGIV